MLPVHKWSVALDELGITSDINAALFPRTLSYMSEETERNLRVQGRVLNRVKNGYAIGVLGIVGFLPQSSRYSLHANFDPRDRTKLVDFYVESLNWSEKGEPQLILSLEPPVKIHEQRTSTESEDTNESAVMEAPLELSDLLNDILKPHNVMLQRDTRNEAMKNDVRNQNLAGKLGKKYKDRQRRSSKMDDSILDTLNDLLGSSQKSKK
jgi:hypothetical protein